MGLHAMTDRTLYPLIAAVLDVSRPSPSASSMPIGLVEAGLCAFIVVVLAASVAAIVWALRTVTKRPVAPIVIGSPAPQVASIVPPPAVVVMPEPTAVAPSPGVAAPAAVVVVPRKSLIEQAPSVANVPAASASPENRFPSVSPQPAWSVSWNDVVPDSGDVAVAFASASLPTILVAREDHGESLAEVESSPTPVTSPSVDALGAASAPRPTDDVDAATPTEVLQYSREDLQLAGFPHLTGSRVPRA